MIIIKKTELSTTFKGRSNLTASTNEDLTSIYAELNQTINLTQIITKYIRQEIHMNLKTQVVIIENWK